jgi:hypothetical protein
MLSVAPDQRYDRLSVIIIIIITIYTYRRRMRVQDSRKTHQLVWRQTFRGEYHVFSCPPRERIYMCITNSVA